MDIAPPVVCVGLDRPGAAEPASIAATSAPATRNGATLGRSPSASTLKVNSTSWPT